MTNYVRLIRGLIVVCLTVLPGTDVRSSLAETEKVQIHYTVKDGAIVEPLTRTAGDSDRGKQIVLDRERGDCLVCHTVPLPDRQMHGTVGPLLDGVGSRYSAEALRLRLVDSKVINPQSLMPAYHRVSKLYRVLKPYRDRPLLTAQEIEDVIAYLSTLTHTSPISNGQKMRQPATGQLKTEPRKPAQNLSHGDTRRSGYTYLSQENQQLQDDEFANPGMLWVERGRELWAKPDGAAHVAC
ncbi:MAG TPA: sulfur oxidation c-type cytochrome SoxX, partial [Nitrospira sp.]|nr:sulfur oxidation c-type cytochrome SoxX [Nitrospira sp.]